MKIMNKGLPVEIEAARTSEIKISDRLKKRYIISFKNYTQFKLDTLGEPNAFKSTPKS